MLSKMGFYYLVLSFFGGILGFSLSMVLSIELNNPFLVLGEYFYYVCLTSHGFMMVFYFLTLLSLSFFNYFMFSFSFLKNFNLIMKTSLMSFYLITTSLGFMILSLFLGESVNVGWTLYTPLTSKLYTPMICLDFLLIGLNLFLLSLVMSSMSSMGVMFTSFFNFESFLDMPMFIWSFLLTYILIVLSMPSLFCVLMMLLLDSNFNTFYFDCEFGGSSILFQSLFWLTMHSEVYILILPVFGIMSQVLYVICGGFLYNSNGMIFSMFSLSILSILVWGHHMSTMGWSLDIKNFFMICTLVISLPTGIKVFSWVYTLMLYGGSFNLVSGFLSLFLLFFSLGGVTGVFLANYSLDVMFHDSYFVVAHFHTILSSSAISGFLSGIFLFSSSIFNLGGYNLSSLINFWFYFWISFSSSLIQFLYSLTIVGLSGVPSSMFNFSMVNYFNFHMGSVSFLGIWGSMFMFTLLFILFLNSNEKN